MFPLHGSRTLAVVCLLSLATAGSAETALMPGDMVAICGDSMTEMKQYSVFIEDYLLMCQPAPGLRVAQFGRDGGADSYAGHMDNEVLRFKPTVATTYFGMNDGHYGGMNPDVKRNYNAYTKPILQKLKGGGLRVIVLGSTACVDSNIYGGSLESAARVNNTLASLRDIAKADAEESGVLFADINTPMTEVMPKAKAKYGLKYSVSGNDGVHPEANGHLIIAYAFLKAMGCSGDIGTITVNLAGDKAEATAGHKILNCKDGSVTVESTRYPFCFFGDLEKPSSTSGVVEFFPFNEELNRFRLVVNDATSDRLRVTWGETSKEFAAADLAKGVNLAAEFPDNPFGAPFMKVENAIRKQQEYETTLTKSLLQSLPDWKEAAPEPDKDVPDKIAARAMEKDKSLYDNAVATMTPVRYTITIGAVK